MLNGHEVATAGQVSEVGCMVCKVVELHCRSIKYLWNATMLAGYYVVKEVSSENYGFEKVPYV